MKKAILLCGALLALTASVAGAAGLNLFVNGCDGDLTTSTNIQNPCTSNTGTMAAVASYVAPAGISALSGIEVVVDVQTAGAALPPWWDGVCRQNFLQAAYGHGAIGNPTCEDAWAGATVFGGLAAFRVGEGGPNRGRMIIGWAVSPDNVQPLTPDAEYYASRIAIARASSTTCTGCLEPACIVLNQVTLAQPVGTPGGDQAVVNPAMGQFVTYQGGIISGGCPGATPTQNRTWGSVKSLYR